MNDHQSACAPLPWTSSSPGRPRSPQASVSIPAPATSMRSRSGSTAIARSNQSGAGGRCPSSAASGAGAGGVTGGLAGIAERIGLLSEIGMGAGDTHSPDRGRRPGFVAS